MRELVVNSAGASQFVPQNGTTCHDKIVAKSRASVSLALHLRNGHSKSDANGLSFSSVIQIHERASMF